jgi:uncharacterized membrane protein
MYNLKFLSLAAFLISALVFTPKVNANEQKSGFCNGTRYTYNVSNAYKENGQWVTQGWLVVPPNTCKPMWTAEDNLTVHIFGVALVNDSVSRYVRADNDRHLRCVKDLGKPYEMHGQYVGADRRTACEVNYGQLVRFTTYILRYGQDITIEEE